MPKKMVNIRLDDSVWQMVREDAVRSRLTLQEWVTCALLKAHSDDGVGMIHVNYDQRQAIVYAKDGKVKANV